MSHKHTDGPIGDLDCKLNSIHYDNYNNAVCDRSITDIIAIDITTTLKH